MSFFATFVYASNSGSSRSDIWKSIEHLSSSIADGPWILPGDFKVIRNVSESSRPIHYISSDSEEFSSCLTNAELEDHAFSGPLFTWYTRQRANPILKKLDRVIINHG